MRAKIIASAILIGFAVWSAGAVQDEITVPAEALTEKVRGFLKKEMRLLAEGGRAIEGALAEGDSKTVADEAAKMHEAFVHKDEVTTFDLRILQAVLGEEFVDQDKAFHVLAAELETLAKVGDEAQQRAVFEAMLRACAACHKAYAPEAPVLE